MKNADASQESRESEPKVADMGAISVAIREESMAEVSTPSQIPLISFMSCRVDGSSSTVEGMLGILGIAA